MKQCHATEILSELYILDSKSQDLRSPDADLAPSSRPEIHLITFLMLITKK